MKRTINRALSLLPYSKWLLAALYLLLAWRIWYSRDEIYNLVPMLRTTPLGNLPLDLLLIALVLLGFICLIRELCVPWHMKWKFDTAVRRAKLTCDINKYPVLVAVYPDKHREHGKVFVVRHNGVSVKDFDAEVHHLSATLNGHIGPIEFSEIGGFMKLHFLPRRYMKPTIISVSSKELVREPNLLVVGKTGSGKSYALLSVLGAYVRSIPDVTIIACDYKHSTFAQFSDTPNFYGYQDVPEGIDRAYKEFEERLKANDERRNKQIWVLAIDEYGTLVSSQPRTISEDLKAKVSAMMFMGRSLGIRVLTGIQRADAEYFKSGARDQFRAILALGNLSKEQKQMLFSDYKDSMTERNDIGEGYLLIDGQDIERVKVAAIADMDALDASIREAMNR